MFCKECGAKNKNDAKFCAECGKTMVDYSKERKDLLMPEDIKNKQDINKKLQKYNKVSKILYILSWVFFAIATIFVFCSIYVYPTTFLIIGIVFEVIWFGLLITLSIINHKSKNLITSKEIKK